MLKWFYCPDGQMVPVAKCLRYEGCRMENRCMEIRELLVIADERKWRGKCSTTQLIKGTREAFLELVVPYAINPRTMTFAVIGLRSHKKLERQAKELGFTNFLQEQGLEDDICTGILDLYYMEHGVGVMSDTKTSGSFKVKKALGIEPAGKVPDPSGEVYQKSGKWGKAGDPKMIQTYRCIPAKRDMFDWDLQLNRYRVMAERGNWASWSRMHGKPGVVVHEMRISACVRDAKTAAARSFGVQGEYYKIPVARLPDEYVDEYFRGKHEDLFRALETRECDRCNDFENWNGKKCAEYCKVAHACDVLQYGGCKEHPKYQAIREPRAKCRKCWEFYWLMNNPPG